MNWEHVWGHVLFNPGYEPGERFINPIVDFNFRVHFNQKECL